MSKLRSASYLPAQVHPAGLELVSTSPLDPAGPSMEREIPVSTSLSKPPVK